MLFQPNQSEKQFILDGIRQNMRNDGRTNQECLSYDVTYNILNQADGSCLIISEEQNTKIIIGVKCDIGNTLESEPENGIIQLEIDGNLRGQQKIKKVDLDDERNEENLYVTLRYLLEDLMLPHFNRKQLCIVPGKKCWHMNIDVFILGHISKNLIDIISLGIRGALLCTQICKITPIYNELQDSYEMELSNDKNKQTFSLDVSTMPIILTIGEVGDKQVIDLDQQEVSCFDTVYTVSATGKGVCGFSKFGESEGNAEDVFKVLNLGRLIAEKKIQGQEKDWKRIQE